MIKENRSQTIRLFLAIPLPQSVRNEIAHLQTTIKKSLVCEGNYTNPTHAHLTIAFIGSVETEEKQKINAALKTVSFPAFNAQLGTLKQFQKHGHSRIIFIDIISQYLAPFTTRIHETLEAWIIKEERSFVGHATILRVKKVHDQEKLTQLLRNTHVESHSFTIDSFVLMQSELMPDGPRYIELDRYALTVNS